MLTAAMEHPDLTRRDLSSLRWGAGARSAGTLREAWEQGAFAGAEMA